MRRCAAFLNAVVLVATATTWTDPPQPEPKPGVPVLVKAGGFADVTVSAPKGASVLLRYDPQPVQVARDLPPGRVVFGGEAGKTYVLTVTVIDFEAKTATQTDYTFVFEGPAPTPPGPGPGPTPPGPTPDPTSPFAGVTDGTHVLLVVDPKAQMTQPQYDLMYSMAGTTFLNSVTAVGPDGKTHNWRVYESDLSPDSAPKVWADAFKRPRKSVPWVYVGNGKSGWEGPLDPATFQATVNKFKVAP